MNINIRFMVYNAYGIGGTVKTIFNFANYFQNIEKYNVEIISVKRTKEKTTLYLNPRIKIIVIQDARSGVKYSEEDKALLGMPSKLIHPEEDLYLMFNAYTDKKLEQVLSKLNDGILITTIPSFNVMAVDLVDDKVLKIGQEHKSFADHTSGIQSLIRENYGKLDALTILTERNRHIYERKVHGEVPIYVLGNGTKRLKFRANLRSHVIVAAGRYVPIKGYDMLIKAFSMISAEFPDWVLKIYGSGLSEQDYVCFIKENNMEDKILLEPATDKLNEKLSEAAFQVCSSYSESFGMTIIEGFAMGVPCVAFACDGPEEIITDGYDGIIVQKECIKELADAMAKVMKDEDFRQEMGNNAYGTSGKYDLKNIGENFEKIIEKALASKQKNQGIHTSSHVQDTKIRSNDISVSFETYNQMVSVAYDGRVGIKTIWKMFKGWIFFKLVGKKADKKIS